MERFYKQLWLRGLFAMPDRQLSKAFSLVALDDLLVTEVSKLGKGLEGATEVFSNRSFRHGCEPWTEAARNLPAVEEVCWRLSPPARAAYLGCFVIEAFLIIGEVSVVCSSG